MFEPDKLAAFIITALSLLLTPGPAKLLLLSTSATRGFRAGLRLALGIFLSDAAHVTLVAVGLGALIVSNPTFRYAIAIVGAGFLLYFATLYARKALRGPASSVNRNGVLDDADPLVVGLFLNLLNPLAIAFYVGLLPQFADPESSVSVTAQLAFYGGALIVLFLLAHAAIAFAASRFRATGVSSTWFRVSYGLAALVLVWLCARMLVGTFA